MVDEKAKEENFKHRKIVDEKLTNGIPLTIEEQYFRCSNYTLKGCRDEPSCIDEYYYRVYMFRREGTPTWLQIECVDRNRFIKLVRDWQAVIEAGGQHQDILKATIKETKEEIKILKKQYSAPLSAKRKLEYNLKHFDLLAWSKLRHIMIQKIFDLSIKAEFYSLHVNGKEIRFDAYSYAHILTRHFGHVMKQYQTEKDHFYDVFLHTDLHVRIDQLFKRIDQAKALEGLPNEEITIKFRKLRYRLYVQPQERYQKDKKGRQPFLRLTTFFPLTDAQELEKLKQEYEERKVDSELSVFVHKS
ncbi:MAG TPA: hypothetical protein VK543_01200 [Puia sp.]|nr:hypothetical protein [Puia sp.]